MFMLILFTAVFKRVEVARSLVANLLQVIQWQSAINKQNIARIAKLPKIMSELKKMSFLSGKKVR